jgi:hypothetical protein
MPPERIPMKLDDFFESHAKVPFLATIEPTSEPANVKITPWQSGVGCLCGASLVLPRTAVVDVEVTTDLHHCCGKALRVLRVEFASGHVPLEALFGQLMQRSLRNDGGGGGGGGDGPKTCLDVAMEAHSDCVAACPDEDCDRGCDAQLAANIKACRHKAGARAARRAS